MRGIVVATCLAILLTAGITAYGAAPDSAHDLAQRGLSMSAVNQNNAYVLSIIKTIFKNWESCGIASVSNQPYPVISLDLLKNGTVTNVQVTRQSGIIATDLACSDAVLSSNPFPATPVGE